MTRKIFSSKTWSKIFTTVHLLSLRVFSHCFIPQSEKHMPHLTCRLFRLFLIRSLNIYNCIRSFII